MSKNRPLSQPKVLHVVIMHASHRYILCWYILCWYMLCVLCAVYFAAVSHVRFVTICHAIYTVQRESRSSRQQENPTETVQPCTEKVVCAQKKSGQMHSRTSAPQNPKVFKHFQFYLSHIQLSITVQIKASNELNLLALSYSSAYSDAFFMNPPAMYLMMLS